MKKYLRPFYNHPLIINIRNWLGIYPVFFKELDIPYASSDLFFWRTDEGFSTSFRASDIANDYFGESSILKLIFFNKEGLLLNEVDFEFKGKVIEFIINHEFIGYEGYGSFLAFNLTDNVSQSPQITNRCYTGYSKNGSIPSFVHGNVISKYIDLSYQTKDIDIKNRFYEHRKKNKYLIQKDFGETDRNDFIFMNPLNREISITLNGTTHPIGIMETMIIQQKASEIIEIESDFGFPRPLVFSYSSDFFDVHHA